MCVWVLCGGEGLFAFNANSLRSRVSFAEDLLLISEGLAVTIMFSTIGMALFKGKFHSCNDEIVDGLLGEVRSASSVCEYALRLIAHVCKHTQIAVHLIQWTLGECLIFRWYSS